MDVFKFAYFPFLNSAVKYVEALDFKLDELFSERAFEQVRLRGKERVLSAIGEGITNNEYTDIVSAEKEIISYAIARILVSCINDNYLIKRYALAEAKCAYENIRKLSGNELKELAEDFNIVIQLNDRVVVHFTDYIRYASTIHEHRWKLVNRNMEHGNVTLTEEDFSRLLEEAIRERIESNLPVNVPHELCAELQSYLEDIRDALKTCKSEFSIEEFSKIMPDCFPPCMVHALSNAKAGVNLPHSMRFALVSFLLNIGMNAEGIIDLFRVSPDFDEERTRYQVMHISGSTGTTYTSPSCATMITYGNCFGKEALCERISHPLTYYRRKAWMLKKEKPNL